MHLVLTGATGLVGSGVLHAMLSNPGVHQISILSRRPVSQAEGQAKAQVIIHKDFSKYDGELMKQLKDVNGVVWAQGISSTQVGKDEYEQITSVYPLAFAKPITETTNPNPVNFVYVSSEGATQSPGIFTPSWAAVKGRTESSLIALAKDPALETLRPLCLRPCGVDAMNHTEIHKFLAPPPAIKKVVDAVVLPLIRSFLPGMISPTRDLGRVLTELAMGNGESQQEGDVGVVAGGEGSILNNAAMLRLAGLTAEGRKDEL